MSQGANGSTALVPLIDPICDPVSRERGALRDHPAQVLCRSVLVIIHAQVGFAIPIDIGDRVRIIGAPLPARHGAILAHGHREAGSLRLEQSQGSDGPMGAVEEGEIGFAIPIDIADEVLMFQGKSCLPFASFTRWLTHSRPG